MPEPTGRGSREFFPSVNQALSELEEATGKPVMTASGESRSWQRDDLYD